MAQGTQDRGRRWRARRGGGTGEAPCTLSVAPHARASTGLEPSKSGAHHPLVSSEASTAATGRLLLRPVGRGDAGATAALMTHPVANQLSTWHYPMSEPEAAERIARAEAAAAAREALNLAICRLVDEALLGWIGFAVTAPGRARLGYWLGEAHQGRGYMAEAVPAALTVARAFLRLRSIEASVHPDNRASIAVLERLGMARTGERLEAYEWRGVQEVCACYELILPDDEQR